MKHLVLILLVSSEISLMTLFALCMLLTRTFKNGLAWFCSLELHGREHINICKQRNAAAIEHALDIWYVATFIFIWNTGQGIKMLSAWLPPGEDICYSTHGRTTTLWVAKKKKKKKTCREEYNNLGGWLMGSWFVFNVTHVLQRIQRTASSW